MFRIASLAKCSIDSFAARFLLKEIEECMAKPLAIFMQRCISCRTDLAYVLTCPRGNEYIILPMYTFHAYPPNKITISHILRINYHLAYSPNTTLSILVTRTFSALIPIPSIHILTDFPHYRTRLIARFVFGHHISQLTFCV